MAAALAATAKAVAREVDEDIRAKLDEVVLGWALVVAAIDPPINTSAVQAAQFPGVDQDAVDRARRGQTMATRARGRIA